MPRRSSRWCVAGDLAEVADDVDWTAGELADTLLTDDSLFVTEAGDVGYADTAPGPTEFTTVEPSPEYADASTVLTLHSQPVRVPDDLLGLRRERHQVDPVELLPST